MKKIEKTNAMRILEASGAKYELHMYADTDAVSGLEIVAALDENPDSVFKTLVTVGKSGEHYVFVVPVSGELDLKKAASAVGEKYVEMVKSKELLPLTGYIHGGCSPIGMKKLFPTVVDETAQLYDTIIFSAGKIGYQVEIPADTLAQIIPLKFADITSQEK